MESDSPLELLRDGKIEAWNDWRRNAGQVPSLEKVNLRGTKLTYLHYIPETMMTTGFDNYEVHIGANLSRMNLAGADLAFADLRRVNLSGANLSGANLVGADLAEATLDAACLEEANLEWARLVRTTVANAIFTRCKIYGAAVWDLRGEPADQTDLTITPTPAQNLLSPHEPPRVPTITADNLDVAQFFYLLLNNAKIRAVVDTVGKKAVLILGRFTGERQQYLEVVRARLRECGFVPILFDFIGPSSRDLTETIRLLAHLSRFVVVDLTDPRSVPKELEAIVPDLAVPVQPIIASGKSYTMFRDYWKYGWVLEPFTYGDRQKLEDLFQSHVVAPAEKMAMLLEKRRNQAAKRR